MALDQLHEQNNQTSKRPMVGNFAYRAGILVLTWSKIYSVEISRIINEFEDTFRPHIENSNSYHTDLIHDTSFAGKFSKDVKTLNKALPVNPLMIEKKLLQNK